MCKKKIRIYLAAGLFDFGSLYRNAVVAQSLVNLGYTVIVPQREAKKFRIPEQLVEVAIDCFASALDPDNIVVMIADGAEPDCGASFECGGAMAINKRMVYVRTDGRTSQDVEAGMNAMFRLPGVQHVIHPCRVAEVEEFAGYCDELAELIHQAIQKAVPDVN